MSKNITPQHMRCPAGYCEAIYKTDDGNLLIVGKYARQQDMDACGARADLQEVGVIISPDLLADVERDIIEECAKVAELQGRFINEAAVGYTIAQHIRALKPLNEREQG